MTLQINQHLVVTKDQVLTLINAVDILEVLLHGNEDYESIEDIPGFILEDLKTSFPPGLICETRNKLFPIEAK